MDHRLATPPRQEQGAHWLTAHLGDPPRIMCRRGRRMEGLLAAVEAIPYMFMAHVLAGDDTYLSALPQDGVRAALMPFVSASLGVQLHCQTKRQHALYQSRLEQQRRDGRANK